MHLHDGFFLALSPINNLQMKKAYTLITLIFLSAAAVAQVSNAKKVEDELTKNKTKVETEGWTTQGLLNIGLNQGTLQNWAAGGEQMSLAMNGVFNGLAVKKTGNKIWENTVDMFYGLNYVSSNNFVPRKIDDRIDVSSRYGVKPLGWTNKPFLKNTYLMGLARLQTQFSKGYNYENPDWRTDNNGQGISNFLSPLYATFALGAEYRPNKNFGVFVSPAAARIIMADKVHTSLSPNGAFGIDSGETFTFQFGAYLTARYSVALTKRIDYRTRLDLYSNYLEKPQNVDVLWDNIIAFKISEALGGSLGVTMVYDDDVTGQLTDDTTGDGVPDATGALGWTQLKQVLNLGLQYKFPKKKEVAK